MSVFLTGCLSCLRVGIRAWGQDHGRGVHCKPEVAQATEVLPRGGGGGGIDSHSDSGSVSDSHPPPPPTLPCLPVQLMSLVSITPERACTIMERSQRGHPMAQSWVTTPEATTGDVCFLDWLFVMSQGRDQGQGQGVHCRTQ